MARRCTHLAELRYRLIDLHHADADRLLNELLTEFGTVALEAMALAGNDAEVIKGIERMARLLSRVLEQPDGWAALGVLLEYLLLTHERIDKEELRRAVEETGDPRAGEYAVTMYEQLIDEGRTEGRAEGRAEMLLELLAAKFAQVPADVRARVEKAALADLVAWGRRVLTAATLAEVFEAPASTGGA